MRAQVSAHPARPDVSLSQTCLCLWNQKQQPQHLQQLHLDITARDRPGPQPSAIANAPVLAIAVAALESKIETRTCKRIAIQKTYTNERWALFGQHNRLPCKRDHSKTALHGHKQSNISTPSQPLLVLCTNNGLRFCARCHQLAHKSLAWQKRVSHL